MRQGQTRDLRSSNSRKRLNRGSSRQSLRSSRNSSKDSLNAEVDDGSENMAPQSKTGGRLRGQKSATGNFAIPDSLDEDNFAQLKNGNQRFIFHG